jgi:hypothetical protein
MLRTQKKYNFVYKTTNIKNGKFYIGMHSTDNLEDGYIGSGKRLWHSINYHGKENFKFEILEFFESREALVEREKQLVNEDLLKDQMCMNLKPGGTGGWPILSNEVRKNISRSGAYKINKKKDEDLLFKKYVNDRIRDSLKSLYKKGELNGLDWTGKSHSAETKKKISNSHKGRHSNSNNSQYGTMWITNGIENKKIKKEDSIPEGWQRGRKL